MGKLFRVLFTKGPSFGKSQLLHGVTLANQNKTKWREIQISKS